MHSPMITGTVFKVSDRLQDSWREILKKELEKVQANNT
jgi:hypothetical protein